VISTSPQECFASESGKVLKLVL